MRTCDNPKCKKAIHLGQDRVDVTFVGASVNEKAIKILGSNSLDFCSIECFAEYLIFLEEEKVMKK